MPVYHYNARDIKGRKVHGEMEAANLEGLMAHVKKQDQFLLSYEIAAKSSGQRLKGKELADFNRQIGTMLSSGVTLLRSIEIILRRDISARHRKIYEELYTSLLSGVSFSDAMEAQGKVFPQLLINMYRAGEANGRVDVTANRMADHYDKEYRLQGKIKSASMYPIFLLVLTLVVVIIVFTAVIPQFSNLYGNMELPAITRFVMGISQLFTDYFFIVLLAIVLLFALVSFVFKIPKVRLLIDRLKFNLPIIGRLVRVISTARFARTLSSLYASGLSILTALQISKGTVGNHYIASQFDDLVQSVRSGVSLAESLEKVDGFDKKLAATVMVGEESGKLENMLLTVADSFDYEANEATQRLLAILEPLMIVLMAVIVGMILISVMLPIYTMYDRIGTGL